MIVPESLKVQGEITKRIKANLEAGDWGPAEALNTSAFVPLNDEGGVLQEEDVHQEDESD